MTAKRILNAQEALEKMRKYCAYQERSHYEVRYKLVEIGIRGDTLENIMSQLIEEGFLDEERFAKAYARGKFRNKQWGKQKIRLELERRKIGTYLQKKALEEIDEKEYHEVLIKILQKKKNTLRGYPEAEQKLRLFKFAFQRGFEAEAIYKYIPLCYE